MKKDNVGSVAAWNGYAYEAVPIQIAPHRMMQKIIELEARIVALEKEIAKGK